MAADFLKELLQRPGFWYSVRVFSLVMKDMCVVLAYLDLPTKARLGALHLGILGPSIFPADRVIPKAHNVTTLTNAHASESDRRAWLDR